MDRELKSGDYVLISSRNGRDLCVKRVKKITKTQVVAEYPSWGRDGFMSEDRYRLKDGNEISSSSWWYRSFISNDVPSKEQISQFETSCAVAKKHFENRKKAEEFQKTAQNSIASILGLPVDRLKVDWSFDNDSTVWKIEVQKLDQSEIERIAGIQ